MSDSNNTNSASTVNSEELARQASRKKLILIFALFFVPLLLATIWMQMLKMGGGQWGNTSNGELISPAYPLQEFSVATDSDLVLNLDEIRGKWTILYVPEGDCTETCQDTLYKIRQARLALNHRMERVQRVAIFASDNALNDELLAAHAGLIMVDASAQQSSALLDQITDAQKTMETKQELIYLIDPLGNLMMRYTADLLPKPLFKDLKHLLKVSRIG